jgi:hypothetical protein
MDIQVYENILQGLKDYNESIGKPYNNVVVRYPTADTTYPVTVFRETTNLANPRFKGCFDRVATVGYSLEVFAKQKNKIQKDKIAREVACELNTYLTQVVGLNQVGFNYVPQINDNSICRVVVTYTGQLHENRQRFF